jgi:hypothetical protein
MNVIYLIVHGNTEIEKKYTNKYLMRGEIKMIELKDFVNYLLTLILIIITFIGRHHK